MHGWWVDGCYSESDYMRDRADEPNYNSFARALRSGNENALVAFNGGFVFKAFDCEDFTAGGNVGSSYREYMGRRKP